ncbi:SDR family NAD(P)-dependent oxidoreductase [Litoribrevibacter albus]|uniref:Short chain dehydrogenase/reductase n=1 Tax=Litoribrevibacter albus TaxID=1473156 RepID=A0AA37SB82_9GAMM|nr:SDR family NAD(P)-dependent oxidoreductase [Litoribrevibacter albus]GLQ32026.1 putative short chain dehydrogenase/reductase [Litoribrevibacter albus]
MKSLKNKVAVITGAGSGIGRALALQMAKEGCQLALSDVNEVGLKETQSLVEQQSNSSVKVKTYSLDVADKNAVFQHADDVEKEFGQVNLVFNNAGVALSAKLVEVDMADFEWLMNIDFWGVVYGTQAFLPKLIASGDGHIINISSVFGIISVPKQGTYNAAKFAVRGYTEALRQELILDNLPVQVSCVHPGGIQTEIARNARIGESECRESTDSTFDKLAKTSPKRAAEIIISGVKSNKARILVGPDAHVIHMLARVLGARYQSLTQLWAKKMIY